MTEQTIFLDALEITDPAERSAYLDRVCDRVCAGDAPRRRQIETLLAAHARSGEFLDVPVVAQIAAGFSPPDDSTLFIEANSEGGNRGGA